MPCKIPWVAIYIHEPAVICPYMVRPKRSNSRNFSHVAQWGTNMELLMSTRGA